MRILERDRPIVAGNWKMNGLTSDLAELEAIDAMAGEHPTVSVAIAPPITLLREASARTRALAIGAQDAHLCDAGPHTGCVSPAMLADAGASFVILGHSERRADQGETDALVRDKALAALAAGLQVIVCVGETEAERDGGRAQDVVAAQLAGSLPDALDSAVVAYEPVWAIGTGRSAQAEQIAAMHRHVRSVLAGWGGAGVPILYGGSVKADNAAGILALPDVGGALVGGASLTEESFRGIVAAADAVERRSAKE